MPKQEQQSRGGRGRGPSREREVPEFDQKIIDLARVTRVMAGGKRMRFRACVAIGDHAGRFGVGLAKGADVTLAVNKAVNKAKKQMVTIPMVNETIPHPVYVKFKAAKILLKPAPRGTGIKAGGALRMVFELSGLPNVVAKMLGTGNKVANVTALVEAMSMFKPVKQHKKAVVKDEKAKVVAPVVVKEEVKVEAPVVSKKADKPAAKKKAEKTDK